MAQKKLLVADDSLTIQKVIRLALGNEGYEIQTVSDGAQALEQIATFRPDIVLIDVSLAKMSAFEVKNSINQHRDLAHVKFVLMSSAFKQVDEGQATAAGFDGRLIKPFDPAHLRNIISQALGSRSQPESHSTTTPNTHQRPTTSSAKRNEVDFGSFLSHLNNPPKDEFGADPQPLSTSADESEPTPPTPSKRNEVEFGSFLSHMNNPPQDEFGADPQPLSTQSSEPETESPRSISAPEGMSDDLWKTDTSIPHSSGEDDIRKLTESTLKMSGLADESGWSVQEKKAPSGFQNESPSDLGFQFTMPETQGNKADPTMEPHHQLFDFESSWTSEPIAKQAPVQKLATTAVKPVQDQWHVPEKSTAATTSSHHQAETQSAMQSFSLDHEELEKIIKQQVSDTLEKILKTMLPDIAERVIKEEIHKMLENPPSQL